MIRIITLLLVSLLPACLYAQTGPGGVGNAQGTGSQPANSIWLDAEWLELTNGDAVQTWTDRSGNGNDASQPASVRRPQFLTNSLNGHPVIRFDNTGDADFMPIDGSVIVNTDYTLFIVAARRSTGGRKLWIGGTGAGTNQNLHAGWNGTNFMSHHYGNDFNDPMISGSGGTAEGTFGIFMHDLGSSLATFQRKIYQNGTELGGRNNGEQLVSYSGAAIARAFTSYYDVDVAEMIIYGDHLNQARRTIVDNYLSAKYDISISNDRFTGNNGNYTFDLAGIGKEADGSHTLAGSTGFYISERNGSLDIDGEYLLIAHDNTPNARSASGNIKSSGAEAGWSRQWYLEKTLPAGGSIDARLAFDFREGFPAGEYPQEIANYVLLYRSNQNGPYSQVTTAGKGIQNGDQLYFDLSNAQLQNGYYTIGTLDEAESPIEGAPGTTLYSYQTGSWNNPDNWTFDPDGSLLVNPDNLTPGITDNVVVLNGRTMTIPNNNKTHLRVEIEQGGIVDLGTTTGHNFGSIEGAGRIRISSDNIPSGNISDFAARGTVEYTGGAPEGSPGHYDLSTSRNLHNVIINLYNSANVVNITADLSLTGKLTVTNGTLMIGDATSTQIRTLNFTDVEVRNAGQIRVGTGNTTGSYSISGNNMPATGEYHAIFHQIIITGDFINNGQVRFTNLNAPVYNEFASNGAATVRFQGAQNNTVTLNNTTDFYNLVVEKGSDKTYELDIFAADKANFALYGPNSIGRRSNSPFTSADPEVRKALWIRYGTLKLSGNVFIPTLSEGGDRGGNGDYAIGSKGALWIAGTGVEVYSTAYDNATSGNTQVPDGAGSSVRTNGSNQALSIYGRVRITDGFLGTRNSAGLIFWSEENGEFIVEGGTVDVAQCRAASSGSGRASYIQNGGTVYVRGNEVPGGGETSGTYGLFNIETADAVFTMSGGTLYIEDNTGNDPGGIEILSGSGSYNVTGGKVVVNIRGNTTCEISSTANFYNFELTRRNTSNTARVELQGDLVVTNNFSLASNTEFRTMNYALTVGGDFTIAPGATYANGTSELTLNGNTAQNLSIDGTLADDLHILNLSGEGYSLSGSGASLTVNNELNLYSGVLDIDTHTLTSQGNILNNDTITATTGRIIVTGGTDHTIAGDGTGVFPDFELNEISNLTTLTASQKVSGTLYLTSGILDLGVFGLTADNLASDNPSDYGPGTMIRTSGAGSDLGLLRLIPGDGTYYYPLGTNSGGVDRFTPARINLSDVSDEGYVRVSLGDVELPTLAQPQGDALTYFWRVVPSGFSTVPTASYTVYASDEDDIDSGATPSGVTSGWVPGFVLNASPFSRTSETAADISGLTFSLNNSGSGYPLQAVNITAGESFKFTGSPAIYYSRRADNNGSFVFNDWNDAATWSTDPVLKHMGAPASDYPGPGDVAVIGYGNINQPSATGDASAHRIDVNGSVEVSALIFNSKPGAEADRLDLSRLRFDRNESGKLGLVSGVGDITLLMRTNDAPDLEGDFGDFVNEGRSMFAYNLQNNGVAVIPPDIKRYPQIRLNGTNNFNSTIKWQNDFTARLIVVQLDASLEVEGTMTVTDTLRLGNNGKGRLRFPSATAATYDIGLLQLDSYDNDDNNVLNIDNGNNGLLHKLIIRKGIELTDGSIDLFTNNTTGDNVLVDFRGNGRLELNNSSGSTPEFYRMHVGLENGLSDTLVFNSNFTLNALADQAEKPLSIENGLVIFNHPDLDIDLNAGGSDFTIPIDGGLTLSQGTARLTADGYGLELNGFLRVENTGQLLLDGGAGTDTYLEYSNTGTATLQVAGGTLVIGSQLRRFTEIVSGILSYEQTGGAVMVGKNAAPENNRGVFEIINTASDFTLSGGTLTLVRSQDNAQVAALYLDPGSYNLSNSAEIIIGNNDTPVAQSFGVYSNIPLQNLSINSFNSPGAYTYLVPLVIENDLNILPGATYDARGLSLTIGGDMNNSGLFIPDNNTTYFNGNIQAINGDTDFYNLWLTPNTSMSLTSGSTALSVAGDLTVAQGAFYDNNNVVAVLGNVSINGAHISGGTGGLLLNGDSKQSLSGTGTYGRTVIDNLNKIQASNSLTFNNQLIFRNGSFDIRDKQLTLTSSASLGVEGDGFSTDKMIITNGSQSDLGIVYPIKTGAGSYSIPLGISFPQQKYLPVELSVSGNTTAGTLRVVQVNNSHPTSLDPNNMLQFYWDVEATGMNDLQGILTFNYIQEDVLLSGSNSEAQYIPARLVDTDWFKFPASFVDEAGNQVIFSLTGNDLGGEYTAGTNSAIPDNIKIFTYRPGTNGNWNNQNNWSDDGGFTYGASASVPADGPSGAIVVIPANSSVQANGNLRLAHETRIEGKLIVGNSYGHSLGKVTGTGTLSIGGNQRATLPAGDYSQFFSCSGGGLEYTGDLDITVAPEANSIRRLIISGNGTKTLPYYGNMEICEELRVESGVLDNSTNDNYLRLKGDLNILPGASVNFGSNSSRIYFDGTGDQYITGDLTGPNAMNTVYINKASGEVILNDNLEVDNIVSFQNGKMRTSSGAMLIMNSLSNRNMAGNANSFVNGPMGFRVVSGTSRVNLPVGKDNRYAMTMLNSVFGYSGNALWTVEYFNNSPEEDGLSETVKTGDELVHVSGKEYWRIEGPTPGFATIRLFWDEAYSEVSPLETEQGMLRIAEYTPEGWVSRGGNVRSDFNHVTATDRSSFSVKYFTFGSVGFENPLPVNLVSFTGQVKDRSAVLRWTTATEKNNDYFEVQHSADGTDFTTIGIVDGQGDSNELINYSFIDHQPVLSNNYYRLKQVDFDGMFEYSKVIILTLQPKPGQLVVYPNPGNGSKITYRFDSFIELESASLIISDMYGRPVYSNSISPNEPILLSNEINLTPGVYVFTVRQSGKLYTQKVVIK
ncbi:T9SS type A sorting domain-containing protein [Roseivirga sp. BDSF3-8]|uniref:T9SS type A sorting domain-containing protein n=1 Tax=Roseivirga sp. BDSF3-8 TaxID=3241598 RepID=UPI003531ED67